MTLNEAIIHAEEVARREEREVQRCSACAIEHRQLAEWLRELRDRRLKEGDA